jgi:hypothetical protein
MDDPYLCWASRAEPPQGIDKADALCQVGTTHHVFRTLDSPHDETSVHGLAHAVVRLPVGQSCLQTIQKCLRMRQRAQAASIRGCFYTE